jgi:signal transduction histidine kinase
VADDASDHGHDVSYTGPAHLDVVLRPSSFRRAVNNLVDNAVRYGERVTISLTREADEVVLTVEDDGPGIPPDAIARVCEPFVRLDTARGRDTSGFGLGLSIVAQAVAAEGGRLHLANRPEGGLSAQIALPAALQ